MKITSELIQQSNQFINPLKERQLDLRGEFIYIFFFPDKNLIGNFY